MAFFPHDARVNSVVFSPNGSRLATRSDDGTAYLVDTSNYQKLVILQRYDGVKAVVFSPNSSRLATKNDDSMVRLIDTESGEELSIVPHGDNVNNVVFSPDSRRLATASDDGTARLVDTESGKQMSISQYEESVNAVVFSPDGSRLAIRSNSDTFFNGTLSRSGTALLIDTESGEQLAILQHETSINAVIFSPDGNRLATASSDGTVRLWRIYMSDLVELACQILSRNFTNEEWKPYVGDAEPYRLTCPDLPAAESTSS